MEYAGQQGGGAWSTLPLVSLGLGLTTPRRPAFHEVIPLSKKMSKDHAANTAERLWRPISGDYTHPDIFFDKG
jgi:hypothetical protein